MVKILIAFSLVLSTQAHAFEGHEIVGTEPCPAPRVMRTDHGEVKTQTVLTYLACQDGRSLYLNAEISLPGNSPVIQKAVGMLCNDLRKQLQAKRIDIEMSACMKE